MTTEDRVILTLRSEDVSARAVAERLDGRTVAVVVPARDEAATVGAVVRGIRSLGPLVADVVVVDGDSRDDTAAIAERSGARVVAQAQAPGGLPARTGKGDALWTGVAVTDADLVAFVDADIVGFDPRLVVGLVAPLVHHPTLRFVKAAYDRPLRLGGVDQPTGGGRVTELVARPLLAALWPELATFAQPLAGEYAGTRETFEAVPFRCGYGVELGLLIDVAERFGTASMAQVDLGARAHHHQPLDALGRMAAEILRTAFDRLERDGRWDPANDLAPQLPQVHRTRGGGIGWATTTVGDDERPALADLRAGRA